MSALEAVGKVVVMRGLCTDARAQRATRLSPRIGIVVRAIHPELLLVKLWMGHGNLGGFPRWCPTPRRVDRSCVVRLATPRERATGMVHDPLPAVAS